jgi:hypothetical protein
MMFQINWSRDWDELSIEYYYNGLWLNEAVASSCLMQGGYILTDAASRQSRRSQRHRTL